MDLRPVEGHKHLFRDMETGAILNTNHEAGLGIKHAKVVRQKAVSYTHLTLPTICSV